MDINEMIKRQLFSLDILADLISEKELLQFKKEIVKSRRIFIAGCGRSKLSLLGFAMRLMHLGKEVHIVGDVLTPSFHEGDTLFSASASGKRESLIYIAKKAQEYGGTVNLFTTQQESAMACYADNMLMISVDEVKNSEQFKRCGVNQNGGNLFEELVLVLADSLVQYSADEMGVPQSRLMELHANFE